MVVGIPPFVTANAWNGGTLTTGNNIPAGLPGANNTQGSRKLNLRDTAVPIHLEVLYLFQVNRFIAITPGALVVLNPNGQANNDPLVVYTVRTTFAF